MDDDKLRLKPEFLVNLYTTIDYNTRELEPPNVRNKLTISRGIKKMKTKFYV